MQYISNKCNNLKALFAGSLGCANTYSGVPKVKKYIIFRHFPIHLDPRIAPSEIFSKIFESYYPGKPVEVLLYDLPYSGFGQITWAQKIHEGVGLPI